MRINAEKMDETLKELMTGILLFVLMCLLIGVWFVPSAWKYILGLFIGMVLAEAAAVHMYVSLRRNMDMNAGRENAANTYSVKNSMIRYAVILIVFLVVCLTDFAYPLAVFLGIMGLKAGAYLQPYTRKYLFRKREEDTE
ncbi:MAG: ATP synthase subunit I [Lachnospiraceae bacterium]|nr:ATP synthase subunit I [Lachnospiraceae bacterium]